jgi:hypothetical protein
MSRRGAAPAAGTEQRRAFYEQVEKEVKTESRLSIVQMCEVAGFSRAGYYRFLDPVNPAAADMVLHRKSPWSGPVMGAGGLPEN